jgi:nicotinamidase-related amidase
MSKGHSNLLDPKCTALLVVDVQERFRPVMEGFDSMASGCARLARAFRILELPILVTEQYPRGLGHTVPEVLEALGPDFSGEGKIPEKTSFSACGCPQVPARLEAGGVKTVLVCGIETHVCVNQSVHDLLAGGYAVQVAIDAVLSRHASDREGALRKMERSGAVLTTCEMACFELLGDARHPRFKEVQGLFK